MSTKVQQFWDSLHFQLDGFQKEAIDIIENGHSVIVSAPTGSGKTIIAEYCAYKVFDTGFKLFYTTPLKALSNQKFYNFKEQFGEENVGLLTGDISINRDATIVVMTTEVFRNMLYGQIEESSLLKDVGFVILDECHYMNDAERGTVWEESIIYCPKEIQIVGLSATIANAQELTEWIHSIHPTTRLIESSFRPVPLRFFYYNREYLLPLFEAPGRMNQKLKTDFKGNRLPKKLKAFRPTDLIEALHEKDMLPAIVFTFSRKGCDDNLRLTRSLRLLNGRDRALIREKLNSFLEQNPFLKDHPHLPFIENGFASHHAGLLPALKLLVEQLFQEGLIKAVFATETLAAGINMPARSTVISSISKRTNDGHRLLTANEFLQMSGRAGRRGMDAVGYVVVVNTPHNGAKEAFQIANSPSDPLNSQFTPTYGMVLNLLQKFSLEEARYLLDKSFAQFTVHRRLSPIEGEIYEKTHELNELMEFCCPDQVEDKAFHQYLKSRSLLKETYQNIHLMKRQLKRYGKSQGILSELSSLNGRRENLLATMTASPCHTCKVIQKHEKSEQRIVRLQKSLQGLNEWYEVEKSNYWQQFLNIYELLKETGYLDAQDKPSPYGTLTSKIRTENEFLICEIISKGYLDTLEGPQLAAIICALINDSNRDNIFTKKRLSGESHMALDVIYKEIKHIQRVQRRHHIELPLTLNPVASSLVEAWASGCSWEDLVRSTNMDEGDLVRIIRRTADILRQFKRIDEVPIHISHQAHKALKIIYRDPIREVELAQEAEALLQEELLQEESAEKTEPQ